MLIPRFVQCVTGLFRLLLACSLVVPLVTDLFLACSACYWLVPCFRNVAPLMDSSLVELMMRFRTELISDSTVYTIWDWFHDTFRKF